MFFVRPKPKNEASLKLAHSLLLALVPLSLGPGPWSYCPWSWLLVLGPGPWSYLALGSYWPLSLLSLVLPIGLGL